MGGKNNAAELEALALALEAARDLYNGESSLVILTDSEYVYNQLHGTHIAGIENSRRIGHLRTQIAARKVKSKVDFFKVPAHAGIPGNELADFLAAEAANNRKKTWKKLEPCTLRKALFTRDHRARLGTDKSTDNSNEKQIQKSVGKELEK